MSRERATLAVIAALSLGQFAHAQQSNRLSPVAPETQRLTRVLDSLTARYAEARARRQTFDDSVSRSRATLDTVRSGPITVLVTSGERRIAAAAARIAVD